jgi:hypothetical protein
MVSRLSVTGLHSAFTDSRAGQPAGSSLLRDICRWIRADVLLLRYIVDPGPALDKHNRLVAEQDRWKRGQWRWLDDGSIATDYDRWW